MNPAGRVRRLEHSLFPRQAVLRWLAEAQRYPSLGDYVRSRLDLGEASQPLPTLLTRVRAAVGRATRGSSVDGSTRVVGAAVRDTVFVYLLVLEANTAADRFTELASLRAQLVTAHLGHDWPDDDCATGNGMNELARTVASDVRVEAAALAALEHRYLDGHRLLFPDSRDRWRALEEQTRLLEWSAQAGGAEEASFPRRLGNESDDEGFAAAVEARLGEVVDDARYAAYAWLGEHRRAHQVLDRRLRG